MTNVALRTFLMHLELAVVSCSGTGADCPLLGTLLFLILRCFTPVQIFLLVVLCGARNEYLELSFSLTNSSTIREKLQTISY